MSTVSEKFRSNLNKEFLVLTVNKQHEKFLSHLAIKWQMSTPGSTLD